VTLSTEHSKATALCALCFSSSSRAHPAAQLTDLGLLLARVAIDLTRVDQRLFDRLAERLRIQPNPARPPGSTQTPSGTAARPPPGTPASYFACDLPLAAQLLHKTIRRVCGITAFAGEADAEEGEELAADLDTDQVHDSEYAELMLQLD
jgi:hypothetical protein